MKKTEELIKNQINKLPSEIQEVLFSVKWLDEIKDIGDKHGLDPDQFQTFLSLTMEVLIGIIDRDAYSSQVEAWLDIPEEKIKPLVDDIETRIFQPFGSKLVELLKKEMREEIVMKKKQLADLEGHRFRARLGNELNRLKDRLKTLELDLAPLSLELNNLYQEVALKNVEVKEKEKERKEAERSADKKRFSQINSQVETLARELKELQSKESETKNDIMKKDDEMKKIEEEIKDLEGIDSRIEGLKAEVEELTKE